MVVNEFIGGRIKGFVSRGWISRAIGPPQSSGLRVPSLNLKL